jgi:hypothetical protein
MNGYFDLDLYKKITIELSFCNKNYSADNAPLYPVLKFSIYLTVFFSN